MSLINLYKLDGDKIDLPGVSGLKLHVPSPSFDLIVEDKDGRRIVVDKILQPRDLIAEFLAIGNDYIDSLLMRDIIFQQINESEFYVSESKSPHKRWRVHFHQEYTPDRINLRAQTFEVPLTAMTGLAESSGTTLDDLTFTTEKWQVGQGLTLEEPKYTHSTNTFSIFNAGDVAVDPREMPIKIIYRGASNNLKITNLTTGDEWQYDGTSKANDNITLDGIRSLKNDASIFKDTNKKLITIAPGWNHFELTGTSGSFLISFEHRFYYY